MPDFQFAIKAGPYTKLNGINQLAAIDPTD